MNASRILTEWLQLSRPISTASELHPVPQAASLIVPLGYAKKRKLLRRRIAIFFHAFYAEEMVDAIDLQLRNLPCPVDVYFTTDTVNKAAMDKERFGRHPQIQRLEIRLTLNRGRDIYPKIGLMNREHLDYDYVLHIHTKKSSHADELRDWRQFLWQHLLGSPDIINSLFEIFECCPDVGIIAPQHFPFIRPWIHWAGCKELAGALAKRMGVELETLETIDFPSGSMFWARPQALKPLLDLNLAATDFPEESGQLSLTNAHAVERLFFVSCEAAGLKWLKIAIPQWHPSNEHHQSASSRLIVRRFVRKRNVALLHRENRSRP